MCSVLCRSCLYYAVKCSFCADALIGILRKVFITVPVTIYFVLKGDGFPYCLFGGCGVEKVLFTTVLGTDATTFCALDDYKQPSGQHSLFQATVTTTTNLNPT